MLTSQMSPQWAPPSDRPSTVRGWVIISRMRLVVVVDVAGERGEQEGLAVALEQPVEGDLLRGATLALGGPRRCWRSGAARSRADRRAGRSGPSRCISPRAIGFRVPGSSASRAARTSGSRSRATRSASGRSAIVAVGRVGEERVQRRLEAEEHPGRPAGHLRDDVAPGGLVARGGGQGVPPGVGGVPGLGQGVGGGRPGALDEVDEPRPVAGAALLVGDELEHAVAGATDGVAEGEQLVGRGVGAGHEAVLGAVQDRAARAHAAGAGAQRLLGELAPSARSRRRRRRARGRRSPIT